MKRWAEACRTRWRRKPEKTSNVTFLPSSVSPLPAAKQSARLRWACTPVARAWYVGVSGGLGWCPGKTCGRSASSANPPSALPIRWDRVCVGGGDCPSLPLLYNHTSSLGSGTGRGQPHPRRPPLHPRLLVSRFRKSFWIIKPLKWIDWNEQDCATFYFSLFHFFRQFSL